MDRATLKFFEELPMWVPLGDADATFAYINAALRVTNPLLSYYKRDGFWELRVGRKEE